MVIPEEKARIPRKRIGMKNNVIKRMERKAKERKEKARKGQVNEKATIRPPTKQNRTKRKMQRVRYYPTCFLVFLYP